MEYHENEADRIDFSEWRAPAAPPETRPTPPIRKGPNPLVTGLLIGALCIGAPVGGVVGGLAGAGVALTRAPRPAVVERPAATGATVPISTAFDLSELYQRVVPSIVQVNTGGSGGSGIGAGFVIDTDGHILTNNHVIDKATRVTVRFQNGVEATATVVGRDPAEDLALLSAKLPEGIKPLVLADSDTVRPGQTAIAIGSPVGLGYSVTSGIVSAVDRTYSAQQGNSRPLRGLIQTDAAINPGNSGGPLMNDRGEVIGINTLRRQQVEGIGFAVPINSAKRLLPRLLAGETITHAWLGISAQDDQANPDGVTIADVVANSPAGRAGLRSGDVITTINGKAVRSIEDVRRAIDEQRVGESVPISILRSGRETTVNATLAAWPTNG